MHIGNPSETERLSTSIPPLSSRAEQLLQDPRFQAQTILVDVRSRIQPDSLSEQFDKAYTPAFLAITRELLEEGKFTEFEHAAALGAAILRITDTRSEV